MEESRASIGRCALASASFDRRASWRAPVWITGQSENSGSDGASLHRQSRCPPGNVRRRLHYGETAGGPHFRSGPAAAGKFGGAAGKISGVGGPGKIGRPIILVQAVVWLHRDKLCR